MQATIVEPQEVKVDGETGDRKARICVVHIIERYDLPVVYPP